jgi:zinc D-Ala-D-Ala carboxypeptidase
LPKNTKMNEISENITYKEGTRSDTADRLNIINVPDKLQLDNMTNLSEKIFEPLRKHVGGPIRVNSFFRSVELNIAVGGSSSSQHCKGQAFDLDDSYGRMTNAEMYDFIKNNLDFDQMIWEFGDDKNPNWIHVSYVSEENNRNRCLKAYKEHGRTRYTII